MTEALPIGNSGYDCTRKCPLPFYNKISKREGGDKITCPNARCKCNKCEKKSCNGVPCKGVDSRCFLALAIVEKDARKEAILSAMLNNETLEEDIRHCVTEGIEVFVESKGLWFDLSARESSFDEEIEDSSNDQDPPFSTTSSSQHQQKGNDEEGCVDSDASESDSLNDEHGKFED